MSKQLSIASNIILSLPNGNIVKANKPSIVIISNQNIYASTLTNNTKLQIEYKNKNYQFTFTKGDLLKKTEVKSIIKNSCFLR